MKWVYQIVTAAAVEPDTELMLRVKEGDAASFALLLDRHRWPVIHFLYRMTQNQAVAEELAQEVFLRVYRSRTVYEPSAQFTTWLFRIATNLALNWLRDNTRRKVEESLDERRDGEAPVQVTDAASNIEEQMLYQDRLREIRQAVESLPPNQRAAVLMHKYEDLDYAHIARALDCSVPAVKSLLFRAYEKLRVRLAHLN